MSRSERFRARVKIERKIIELVNQSYTDRPIHGLALDSIKSWSHPRKNEDEEDEIKAIATILTRIATKLRIEADSSRVAFDFEEFDSSISDDQTALLAILRASHVSQQ